MDERIQNVWFESERIFMRSDKGKIYSRPLEAFPTLKEASEKDRNNFTIEMYGYAMRWADLDEDIHITSFYEDKEPELNNPIAALFAKFPQLNISEVAKSIGIHKSLLSQYIYGVKKPSENRIKEIKSALHKLGMQLISASA